MVADKVTHGRFLCIEGKVGIDRWTGSDGKEHSDLTLKIRRIRFLDKQTDDAEIVVDESDQAPTL